MTEPSPIETTKNVPAPVFRGIEELREEALTLIEEANRLFKMNIEELYGLTQRINRLQEKAEEAQL